MINLKKWSHWATLASFIVVLLINYLISAGVIFPATQAEVSAKYVNLFTPANFTFSIWGLIFIGVAVSISIGFTRLQGDVLGTHYRQLVTPFFIEWMFYNLLWNILWSYGYVLLALLVILLYTRTMLRLLMTISGTSALRQSPWLLKYPVGLHTGWLIVASFTNLTVYAISIGLDGTGSFAVWWTLAMMIVVLATVAFYYAKYGNVLVTVPALWALIGIMVQHSASTGFSHANPIIFWSALLLELIGIAGILYLVTLHKKQNQTEAN